MFDVVLQQMEKSSFTYGMFAQIASWHLLVLQIEIYSRENSFPQSIQSNMDFNDSGKPCKLILNFCNQEKYIENPN